MPRPTPRRPSKRLGSAAACPTMWPRSSGVCLREPPARPSSCCWCPARRPESPPRTAPCLSTRTRVGWSFRCRACIHFASRPASSAGTASFRWREAEFLRASALCGNFREIMFTGVITAIVTPFRRGAVDEDALRSLVEDQIANGIAGLVPVGTTGESPTLTFEEHIRVVEIVVKAATKRVPLIAGTGANSPAEAIELSLAAKKVGADGMLQVTPYYNKPSQEGMIRHFKAIIEACPLPTILYNVPGRTGCDLLPETIARLAEVPEVVAVKEATGSALRAMLVFSRVPSRIAVLSGDDATAFPMYALGGKGGISVVSNVAPADMAEMWDAAAAGRWDRARELHYKLLPLAEGLFIESNPVPVKSALAMMGRIADELRPPLYPLGGPNREKVRGYLTQVGLL